MRITNYILLINACLLFSILPNQANATKDSSFYRHRISVLPSQIYMREYSLFYEYSLFDWWAREASVGYHSFFDKWYRRDQFDFEFERGFVARCNIKAFPFPKRIFYFAPMGLFKVLSEEETREYTSWRGEPTVHFHQQNRTVLGGYALVGFRSTGKIYFDFYFGAGRRYFWDTGVDIYTTPSKPDDQKIINESTVWADVKLGLKLGVSFF